jgi:hypothetical protein
MTGHLLCLGEAAVVYDVDAVSNQEQQAQHPTHHDDEVPKKGVLCMLARLISTPSSSKLIVTVWSKFVLNTHSGHISMCMFAYFIEKMAN